MSTQITLSNGHFQDAEGNVLALGTLVLQLTADAVTTDASPNVQVCGGIPIVIKLDSSGNVSGNPKIWSNAELTPSGTGYTATTYTAAGAQAWRTPQVWVFTQGGGSTVDIGTLTPTSTSISYPTPVVTSPAADQTIANHNLILTSGNFIATGGAFVCGASGNGSSLGEDLGRFGTGGLRVQSLVANAESCLTIMPNGTNTTSEFRLYNNSNPSNVGCLDFLINGSAATISSLTFGTGVAISSLAVSLPLTATSFNGLHVTTTTGTLAIASSKTLTSSNTLTLAGTDGTTMTFPSTSATIARTDAANVFTGHQTFEGVASTGATGSGNMVFSGSPSLTTPNIGVASGTSLALTGFIGTYNNTATAGNGITSVHAATSQKSETSADTNVLTYAPSVIAGQYRINFCMAVSAQSSATLGWTATWNDSNGHAQAPTNLSMFIGGTAAPALTSVAATNGIYYGSTIIDVDSSGTNIVVKLTFTGTSFTAKVSASIERLI